MKAIITENIGNKIEGYICIPVIYGKITLDDIPDNSLTDIVAIDFIDKIPYDKVDENLTSVVKKMRLNSTIKIRGNDLSLISKYIANNVLTSEEFNKIIQNTKSLHKSTDIINLLKSKTLVIETVSLKGCQYDIIASRRINQNR